MKLKSFTIIEVLIATTIFVCVVALSAASYGMVIKSNKNSREQNTNMECLSSFSELVSDELKSAELSPYIWGIEKKDTRFEFVKIESTFPIAKQYSGLLIFTGGGRKMLFFSGDGLYALPIEDKDFKKGFIDGENIDKKITNFLPSGCSTGAMFSAAKSAQGESYLLQIEGKISKMGNSATLPIDFSIATGEGI